MIVEVISVGSELTSGSTLNTNAKYISGKLFEAGMETFYHTSVDDNWKRIEGIFEIALNRSDILIFTGGLGPTKDDLTKEVICNYLNLDLVLDDELLENIKLFFKEVNRPMTKNNIKQAYRPENSIVLSNAMGTAPGLYINKNGKKIVLLPGPPKEMKPMFDNFHMDFLKSDKNIRVKTLNTLGIGESLLETKLIGLKKEIINAEIVTYVKDGYIQIKIICRSKDSSKVKEDLDRAVSIIKYNLGDYIFSQGDVSLEEMVVKKLIDKNYVIGLCESCTGGLLTSKITSIPNTSKVLDQSLVVYSNQSKIESLNVSENSIINYGAVSSEVAYEMAKGLFESKKLDLVVSTTGVAGPSPDENNNPIGLVYICLMTKDGYIISKKIYQGDRYSIQNKASLEALNMIRKELDKNH